MSPEDRKPIGRRGETKLQQSVPNQKQVDLTSLFQMATQALTENRSALNQADTENQNHGDNMVQVFNMISQVLSEQQGGSPSQQLEHASQFLAQNGASGSAHLYSQMLSQAANQMQGQSQVTLDNAMILVESLLGGRQTATSGGTDLLGGLLGGQPQPSGAPGQDNALDLGDLLNAGLSFMNAKQQGQDNLQAALTAIMSAGPMSQKPHRMQSGQVVANALMQVIAGMSKK
jgi:hypothetical protein